MADSGSDLVFDPFSPGPPKKLPGVLAELRDRFPVYRTRSDIWVISRFDDVKAVQSHPELFSSRPNPYEGAAQPDKEMKPEVLDRLLALAAGTPVDMAEMASAKTIAAADPPQHTRMRRIVSRGFTPPRIREMATAIQEIVEGCLAGIEERCSFDVVEQLAVPLPVEMICHILGIDRSHYSQAKRWSDAFAAAAGATFSSPAERNELMLATIKEFSTYFVPLIESRRAEPKSDLVSKMVHAIDNESLSNVETLMMAITIMVAGNETSTNLIANTVVELLSNPDQMKLLLDDPDLLPAAVDEANRLTSPIQFAFREAIEDTEIAGTPIPRGAIIALHMAAANRDPRRFEEPDRFLIRRPSGKNLAFGHGIHFCLGAPPGRTGGSRGYRRAASPPRPGGADGTTGAQSDRAAQWLAQGRARVGLTARYELLRALAPRSANGVCRSALMQVASGRSDARPVDRQRRAETDLRGRHSPAVESGRAGVRRAARSRR